MRLAMICFTVSGYEQMKKVSAALEEKAADPCAETAFPVPEEYAKCKALKEYCGLESIPESTEEWAAKQFSEKKALLFIGSTGIAVRSIASSVKSKLTDSPVLVMDDRGQYVIPLLSGHVGGANELALQLASLVGAQPIITTATDNHHCFAVDLFAKRNHLQIMNKARIALVSSRVLNGQELMVEVTDPERKMIRTAEGWKSEEQGREQIPVDIRISPKPPAEMTEDSPLWLKPKEYVLGMGCRRGKTEAELRVLAEKTLEQAGLSWGDIYAIASLDLKADEEGLCRLAEQERIPFYTYSAEELNAAEGNFAESDIVKQHTGVSGVCERAAVVACGEGGQLILEKQAENGVTCALAKRKWSVCFDEE